MHTYYVTVRKVLIYYLGIYVPLLNDIKNIKQTTNSKANND